MGPALLIGGTSALNWWDKRSELLGQALIFSEVSCKNDTKILLFEGVPRPKVSTRGVPERENCHVTLADYEGPHYEFSRFGTPQGILNMTKWTNGMANQ